MDPDSPQNTPTHERRAGEVRMALHYPFIREIVCRFLDVVVFIYIRVQDLWIYARVQHFIVTERGTLLQSEGQNKMIVVAVNEYGIFWLFLFLYLNPLFIIVVSKNLITAGVRMTIQS